MKHRSKLLHALPVITSLAVLVLFAYAPAFADKVPGPELSDYFPGVGSVVASLNDKEVKTFSAARDNAGFTFFQGTSGPENRGGISRFVATAGEVILGWGRYPGAADTGKDTSLWPFVNHVVLRVRQLDGKESLWTIKPVFDGTKASIIGITGFGGVSSPPRKLTPGEWTELRFDIANNVAPDGLEFKVVTTPGATFEISDLTVSLPVYEGYFKKDFALPPGKIWKAIANVGGLSNEQLMFYTTKIVARLEINGREVPRGLSYANRCYGAYPVNIAPFLKPGGMNRVGLYGWRSGSAPFLFFQAKVIMESGEVVSVASGADWEYRQDAVADWSSPADKSAGWKTRPPVNGARPTAVHQAIPPAYQGFIETRNPLKRDFYYADDQPVVMDILLPPGLAERGPTLSWRVFSSDREGFLHALDKGMTADFAMSPEGLRASISLGKRESGVYAVDFELRDRAGTTLDTRLPEPFMVIRKLNPKIVSGGDFLAGMDLELEDEIDFTDARTSRPWIEVMTTGNNAPAARVDTPRIVERNGLRYREVTGARRGSFFSYRYEFKHPGDWYVFELEYPDDADRCVEVVVSTQKEGVWSNSQSGAGAETGGKFYKTGEMKKLYWPHIADGGVHSLDIINVQDGWNAAAGKLKIYRVKGDLPAVAVGKNREFSVFTENSKLFGGFGMNFGVGYPKTLEEERKFYELPYFRQSLIELWDMKTAAERYVEYLKFAGQNTHLLGCYQYNEGTAPFYPSPDIAGPSIFPNTATVLANALDINDIAFYAGTEFSTHTDLATFYNNAQVAAGAKTNYMINAEGKQFYATNGNLLANWTLPEYRRKHCQVVADICRTFGGMKNFKGVSSVGCLVNLSDGYYAPGFGYLGNYDDPLAYSYDDATFEAFGKSARLDLRFDAKDPTRFAKRAALIRSVPALREAFIRWRGEQLRDYYRELGETLTKIRPDLTFVAVFTAERQELFKNALQRNAPFKEFLREFAVDLDALAKLPNLLFVRWTIHWQQLHEEPVMKLSSQHPYTWPAKEDDAFIRDFNALSRRGVMCRNSWDENFKSAPGGTENERVANRLRDGSDWVLAGRVRGLPQPGGFNARETFIQAIITSDPELILGGYLDLNVNVGHEDALREIMSAFTKLPRERFEIVLNTGLKTNLAIRQLNRGDETWLYVANPGYWGISGTVTLANVGEIVDLSNGEKVVLDAAGRLPVALSPFGLKAYRVNRGDTRATAYATGTISARELAFLREKIIGRVQELLDDADARLTLSPPDRQYVSGVLTDARNALADKQYAKAWSLLKAPKFWTLWKDYLEKASTQRAALPATIISTQRGDENVLPSLDVKRVEAAPKLTDIIQNGAPWSETFIGTQVGRAVLSRTAVTARYDARNLYLIFAVAERDMKALKADADTERAVFSDDAIGTMLFPADSKNRYFQLGFNAKGAKFDQEIQGGERRYEFNPNWKVETFKGNGYWAALVTLPYKEFAAGTPKADTSWRANFFRVPRSGAGELSIWSRPKDPLKCAHDTARFGYLNFR